jgi:formylglycine-generating enzyme required for sulfatase activity
MRFQLRSILGFVLAAVGVIAVAVVAPSAMAEKRVALVIGNGAYANVPKLTNPANDARAIEVLLRGAGFQTVVTATDLGASRMKRALRDFSDEVRDADIAIVFFAGHGLELGGTNYLIPVDAVLERDIDVADEAIALDRIHQVLEPAKRLRLVILDACRDNPFARTIKRTLVGRSIGRGLAPVDVVSSDTLIAYAAKAGSTAADGETTNSPYTTALVKHLATPGLDVRLALGRVRDEVLRTTKKKQEPFVYGSLGGAEVALVAAAHVPPQLVSPPAPTSTGGAAETVRVCREVESVTSLSMLAVLEKQHTGTPAADCISARIGELKAAQSAALAKPAPIPAPAPEPARPAVVTGPKPGETFRDCPTCPEMVVVPAGSFKMGSPDSEAERSADEGPVRTVTIGAPFAVGKYEVTVGQFKAFVATGNKIDGGCNIWSGSEWEQQADKSWRDPGFAQTDAHPVTCVSWNDAKEYVAWLSKTTGQPYRLLSEAEWEYAARAGTSTPFSTGSTITTKQANFDGNFTYGSSTKGEYRAKTIEVGSLKSPNAFGLHDMHGNVWEWVEDCWIDSYKGAPSDASVRTTACTDSNARVLRGGSWYDYPRNLRSAGRNWVEPDYRFNNRGFRVARVLLR